MQSLYKFDISRFLGNTEYIHMFDDIIRFLCIQITIQLMLVMMDSERYSIIAIDFILLIMYVVVGVMFYWLVFKKLITFV